MIKMKDAIDEIKRALQDKRSVNAMIWESKAYDEYNGSIYSNIVFYLLFHYIHQRPYLSFVLQGFLISSITSCSFSSFTEACPYLLYICRKRTSVLLHRLHM